MNIILYILIGVILGLAITMILPIIEKKISKPKDKFCLTHQQKYEIEAKINILSREDILKNRIYHVSSINNSVLYIDLEAVDYMQLGDNYLKIQFIASIVGVDTNNIRGYINLYYIICLWQKYHELT